MLEDRLTLLTLTPKAQYSDNISKIYNRMLLKRLKPHIDPKLRINQNGFRQKGLTLAQFLVVRRLLKGTRVNNLPAVMTFIDFKKAFDSIYRSKLMAILTVYGVPGVVVSAINGLYTNTEAKVLSPDGDTESFEILAGVLQVDILAPYLYVIALGYAMRLATINEENLGFTLAKARSKRYPTTYIWDTDFTDDIALHSNIFNQAQEIL